MFPRRQTGFRLPMLPQNHWKSYLQIAQSNTGWGPLTTMNQRNAGHRRLTFRLPHELRPGLSRLE